MKCSSSDQVGPCCRELAALQMGRHRWCTERRPSLHSHALLPTAHVLQATHPLGVCRRPQRQHQPPPIVPQLVVLGIQSRNLGSQGKLLGFVSRHAAQRLGRRALGAACMKTAGRLQAGRMCTPQDAQPPALRFKAAQPQQQHSAPPPPPTPRPSRTSRQRQRQAHTV